MGKIHMEWNHSTWQSFLFFQRGKSNNQKPPDQILELFGMDCDKADLIKKGGGGRLLPTQKEP